MASRFAGRSYPQKKVDYFEKMNDMLDRFNRILVVGVDNVQSMQMHNIRIALRGKAEIIMGKNTMMKKVITTRFARTESKRDADLNQKLVQDGLLKKNVGLVMTNADLSDILKVIDEWRIQAPARQGAVSPVDVTIPAGNTGLEPTKTSFFQALNIQTKIAKGTVEIIKDCQVLTVGQRVGSSEAALLQMLKVNPFFYGLEIQAVFDNGSVYGLDVLKITPEIMAQKFSVGVANVAALSLALGYPTQASFPHTLTNAFKNVLSISLGTAFDFTACNGKDLKDAILSGKPIGGGAAASPAAASGGGAVKPAPAPEPEEEEEEETTEFGLFD